MRKTTVMLIVSACLVLAGCSGAKSEERAQESAREQQEETEKEKTREEKLEEAYENLKSDSLESVENVELSDKALEEICKYFEEMYFYMKEVNKYEEATDQEMTGRFLTTISFFYSKYEDGTVGHEIGEVGFEALRSLIFDDGKYQEKMEELKTAYEKSGMILNEGSDSEEADSSMSMGQKNALNSAKSYLSYSAFSYNGLVKQLEYEKFTHDEAVFAADNCGADWSEQAAKAAKTYLEYSSFSKDGLIEQLEYEGFTHEQAVYGTEQNGY